MPASITVERFPSAERLGRVWVFPGGDAGGTAPPGGNAETLPVRSIALGAPFDRVMLALKGAPSPAKAGDATAVEGVGPLLTIDRDGMRLQAAVQPVTDGETTLHLAVEPGAGIRPAVRVGLGRSPAP